VLYDYYLQISYNPDYSIYGFGLYDVKEKKYYCGSRIIEEAFDEEYDIKNIYDDVGYNFLLQINRKQFLKFKKLNFKKQIKMKKLVEILIMLGLEEHVI
jgi:hypothetical protein